VLNGFRKSYNFHREKERKGSFRYIENGLFDIT